MTTNADISRWTWQTLPVQSAPPPLPPRRLYRCGQSACPAQRRAASWPAARKRSFTLTSWDAAVCVSLRSAGICAKLFRPVTIGKKTVCLRGDHRPVRRECAQCGGRDPAAAGQGQLFRPGPRSEGRPALPGAGLSRARVNVRSIR